MKSTNTIIIVVLILIAGGLYITFNNNSEDVLVKNETAEETMMMEKEVMVKGSTYEVYSPEKIMNTVSGDVVLFFKASWCPSCRAVDADIKNNMANIPADLTILEVDYDKYTDLKKKYGVTTQHTFVQVDKDGNMIKKWSGGNTLNSVVSEVK